MKRLLLIMLCVPGMMHAQTSENNKEGKGIHWTTGLSWEQIKQKAKAENKYIFIDAYTTWCGPCKMMDKYVYANDTVVNFFNEHFIAVKAQIDKTQDDPQAVKDWYNDSRKIEGDYAVTAYPSLIFLSPQSTILYKIEGYRPAQKFVDTAKLILEKGTIYNDPYKEYRELVKDYKEGIKHYDRMPYMINTAFKLHDDDIARELFKDHLNYASTLSENARYTKENIGLWSSIILKLDSKALHFFLKDYDKIDMVMGYKGWSENVVFKTIKGRIIDSFYRMQTGLTTTITGAKIPNSEIMFMRLPARADGKIAPDFVEADWKRLKKMIRKYFSEDVTTKSVFKAKMSWYAQHQNWAGYSKTFFSQLDKYPPKDFDRDAIDLINQGSWLTFLYVNDKNLLNKALGWMEKIIKHGANQSNWLDTYANLLYKLGHINEAIQWQEKAIKLSPNDKSLSMTLEQIKKGESTYLDQGAIWLK
jgi:thioredoxin-related protein